ncbi:MAG: fasciclin domain-containing protein [Acidimicrobiales bacterium]
MKFRRLATAAAALTLVGSIAIASPAMADDGPTMTDILESQGDGTDRNWYDFDILAAGVSAAGLSDALDNPDADLTVFAPNDRAFQALVADLYGWRFWFADEARILDKLVELETSAPGTLETVILYHAVPGQIDSATALSVPRGTALTTLQGGDIKVYPYPRFRTAQLVDNDPNDVNPFLVKSKLDIQASNGIIHGISFVLRPVDL